MCGWHRLVSHLLKFIKIVQIICYILLVALWHAGLCLWRPHLAPRCVLLVQVVLLSLQLNVHIVSLLRLGRVERVILEIVCVVSSV